MARGSKTTGALSSKSRGRQPIPEKTKMVLWARAAGRCQYAGCNASLIGDLISGRYEMNASYIAHVVAAEEDGPRGDPELSPKLAKDISNLMLMCDKHHRLIDREDVSGHPPELLFKMKRDHEGRIDTLTSIEQDRACHILRYAARIGGNESPVNFEAIKTGMIPERYPAEGDRTIDIEITGLALQDDDPSFWNVQLANLRSQFNEKVRGRFERGDIKRLGVFALGPIPLLIELGRLLSDISDAEVWQLLREPKGWRWQDADPPMVMRISGPSEAEGQNVALKLEISAPISSERITQVIGRDAPIWSIAADGAHNDIMRSRDDLRAFRKNLRSVFEAIKAKHGESAKVHLFPATPVSASVEIGRVWMPKAHLPMTIYDQNRRAGGFHPVVEIKQ